MWLILSVIHLLEINVFAIGVLEDSFLWFGIGFWRLGGLETIVTKPRTCYREVDAEQPEQEVQDGQPETEYHKQAYEKDRKKTAKNVHDAKLGIKR